MKIVELLQSNIRICFTNLNNNEFFARSADENNNKDSFYGDIATV